ncbi:hypothetical protein [Streptomyces sp. NPDC037389]|uniref:hypothetical protein n=1 Tax=Streptomyces sp. NPDC037389 TaxID=3155369 RepID=UPI0033C8CCBB
MQASPNSVGGEVEKLKFLRGLDAHTLDMSVLPAERRRHLAQIGRRLTAQALVRREPNRRHPILLTLLAQSAVEVLDSVVQLFDQTLSGSESRARIKLRDALAERAKASEDRLALLDEILPVLADVGIPDEDVGMLLREKIGMDRIRGAHASTNLRLPRDHGHLRMLDGSYTYIRQFAPKVLETVRFAGGTEAQRLIEALGILRELNASGSRNVPGNAPTTFVPARWQGYLDEAAAKGTRPRTGTTGSCARCSRCARGCARGTCTCRAHAATTTRPLTCSSPPNGRTTGRSSAAWSARARTSPRPCHWSWTNSTTPSAIWRTPSSPGTGRSASTTTASWSSPR